jgi:transposase-like protein
VDWRAWVGGKKTVMTDSGQIELEVPRDRQARFDPQLIAKYQRRFPRGSTTRSSRCTRAA